MTESVSLDECKHHWVIDQPNGPTSYGTCKICGVKEEFRNSMPGSGWDRSGQVKKSKQQAAEPIDWKYNIL